jgi:branched-chain amino acid transport system substrate-binding protein
MRASAPKCTLWLLTTLAVLLSACGPPTAPGSGQPAGDKPQTAPGASPAASGAAPAEIIVGSALPLTGQESRAGGFFRMGYEMATEEINKDGGIMVKEFNKKIPVRLIIQDDQTDRNLSANLYERLATVDQVNFFLGGYSTGLGVAHAPVADQYRIPYVTGGEAASEIYNRGQKYIFGTISSVENLATSTMEWIKYWQDQGKLAKPGKIALLWENSAHGKDYQRGVNNFVNANSDRFSVVIDEPFQYPGATDHRPLLQKAAATNADFFLVDAHLEDYILMQRQYTELGLYHQVVTYGARGPERSAREQLGTASGYVAAASWWTPDLPYKSSKEFVERFKARYPDVAVEWYHGLAYTAAMTLYRAIEQAGTLDREKVRETLAGIEIGDAIIPGQKVYFRENGQIDNPFVITQNLPDGKAPIVWPLDAQTGESVLPVPRG